MTGTVKPQNQLIAVVFNMDHETAVAGSDAPPSSEADAEVVETAAAVGKALEERGWKTVPVPVRDDPAEAVRELHRLGAMSVFNLVESLGGDPTREADFPETLEAAQIPYTGNGPRALRTAVTKDRVREVLEAANIPAARGFALWKIEDLAKVESIGLRFPLFIKPARTDASIGIDQNSVVRDMAALRERAAHLLRHLPAPCLVEEFLAEPEINVAFIPDALSGPGIITTLSFDGVPEGLHRIVTYDCKWRVDSPEYLAKSVPAAGRLDAGLLTQAERTARAAFLAIGGTSYGRVDLRLDRDGRPCVMDVNPNPDIHPDAGFVVAAKSGGLSYADMAAGFAERASLKG